MKKILFIFIVFTIVATNSFGQTVFDDFSASLGHLLDMTVNVTGENKYYTYITGDNLLIVGGRVSSRNSIGMIYTLDEDTQYVVLAATDRNNTANLMNLNVYQGAGTTGRLINIKKGPYPRAIIGRFNPPATGEYTFELINPSSETAFITMLVLQVNSNPYFTLNPLLTAVEAAQTIFQSRGGQSLRGVSNSISLFGKIIPRQSRTGIISIPPEGNFELLAAGDISVTDIDAVVLEGRRTISRNSGQVRRVDFASFEVKPSTSLDLVVENRASRNPSAFVLGFLVIKP